MIPLTELYGQAIERLKEENPAFLLGLEPRIQQNVAIFLRYRQYR
jgi:hypothetical protein